MRIRAGVYHIFILYELVRLFLLVRGGTGTEILPISWYAAIPLLCLAPALFLMLAGNETEFRYWLPLVSLLKALGAPALVLYVVKTGRTAVEFASMGDLSLAFTIGVACFALAGDATVGLYCLNRGRRLCG